MANQDKFPPLDELKLKEMDLKINTLSDGMKEKKKIINNLESTLKSLGSSLTTEEVQDKLMKVRYS